MKDEWLTAQKKGGGVCHSPPGKHFMITQQHVHCLVDNAKNCDVRSTDSVGDHKKI
jgi:hypothetical protein